MPVRKPSGKQKQEKVSKQINFGYAEGFVANQSLDDVRAAEREEDYVEEFGRPQLTLENVDATPEQRQLLHWLAAGRTLDEYAELKGFSLQAVASEFDKIIAANAGKRHKAKIDAEAAVWAKRGHSRAEIAKIMNIPIDEIARFSIR